MEKGKPDNYGHRILESVTRYQKRQDNLPFPVDQGEIKQVGDDDSDIIIDLYSSTVNLEGDEVQWMVDEERLQVGDVVTVLFDRTGDPIVVAAVFQEDLDVNSPSSLAAQPTSIVAGHLHRTEILVPTAVQSIFEVGTGFDAANVYVNGARLAEGYGYTVQSPEIFMTTPVAASSIVAVDLRIEDTAD